MMTDIEKHLDELKSAAEAGNAEAQTQLGLLMATGEHLDEDLEGAFSWFLKAAQQGEVTAMFNLGIMFDKGLGTRADPGEAALWFWQAAEQGDLGARMKLGSMIILGRGFTEGSSAIRAIAASAEKGHPYAQAFLAKLYLDGLGLGQSDELAEKWFRLAAEQGDESAIFNIGEMMAEGRGIITPEEEITRWFFDLGMRFMQTGDLIKAFDCLVNIKRIDPGNFLAQRLEDEIERANQAQMKRD
ncbi:MAG: tetratricopeptide repeat protein [bacterium]|nr:tetratricopeptide repeat protein [bacterium]MDT8396943.1 tetratricopeptide repeat protein [bacterium]